LADSVMCSYWRCSLDPAPRTCFFCAIWRASRLALGRLELHPVPTNLPDLRRGPSGQLERLFQRYARAAGAVEQGSQGLGLGLYLSKGIVRGPRRSHLGGIPWARTRNHAACSAAALGTNAGPALTSLLIGSHADGSLSTPPSKRSHDERWPAERYALSARRNGRAPGGRRGPV
jgi:hypothetical protein